jgi:uncharacterized SAM-binding protein YcdF (DUF218 family)
MKRKAFRLSAASLAGALVLYVLWTAWAIWTFPSVGGARADAAIVLGASARNGQPSPVFAERINHGIWLYKQRLVAKVIFTGGTPDGESVSLAESAARYAFERGIPANDIILEPYSRITYENLKYASQIGEAKGLRSFLIVSDPLHMRRAMLMAGTLHINAKASATLTTRYTSLGSRLWFLRRETYFYVQYVLVSRFMSGRPLAEAIKHEEALKKQVQRITGKPGSG